jgi:hypothetical protein
MQRSNNMPLWVFLGLMNVETRKGTLILVYSMIICSIASIPLSWYLDDWWWAVMIAPMGLWYWLCLRWADKNAIWNKTA